MSTTEDSAVAYGSFRWYLASIVFGTLAIQAQGLAVAWQVYEMTKDPFALGAIGLAEVIPFVCAVLFAGHVADTKHRKKVAGFASLMMFLFGLTLFLPNFVSGFPYPLALLYIVVILGGVARSFLTTARQAMIAEIIPHSLLASGVRWRNALFEGACVLGPAMAGFLWAWGGSLLTYSVMSVFFLSSLVAMFMVKTSRTLHRESTESVVQSLGAGVSFMLKERLLLGAFTLDLFAVLLGGAVALLPIFAAEILHIGPVGLGWLRAAPSLGAVCMSIVVITLPPLRRCGRLLYLSFAIFGLCIIGFGLSTSFVLSLIFLFISGAADAVNVIIRQTILQVGTPPAMMGRVSAVTACFVGCSNELGTFESGATAKLLGSSVRAVVVGGAAVFGVMGMSAWYFPEIWPLDKINPDQR
jgi:MFS family permease